MYKRVVPPTFYASGPGSQGWLEIDGVTAGHPSRAIIPTSSPANMQLSNPTSFSDGMIQPYTGWVVGCEPLTLVFDAGSTIKPTQAGIGYGVGSDGPSVDLHVHFVDQDGHYTNTGF